MTSLKSSQNSITSVTCSLLGKLQAGCGPMLYVYMGQVWPPTPSSHQQPSASVDPRMGVFCLFDLILYVPSTVFQL